MSEGPLLKRRVGNRFILVICDYATRYPEAVPLHSCDTEQVAEALVNFFARVGVPREILCDQGTNVTSQLMKEIQNLLHVKAIKTTPYLLFAYQEVPQASTGFAPFELLYGHPVCGPLDILKEE